MAQNSVNAMKQRFSNKFYNLGISENFTFDAEKHDGITLYLPASYSGTITNTGMSDGQTMKIIPTSKLDPYTFFDYPSITSGDYSVAGAITVAKINGYRYGTFNAEAVIEEDMSRLETYMDSVSTMYANISSLSALAANQVSLLRYPSKLSNLSSLEAVNASLLRYPSKLSTVSSIVASANDIVMPNRTQTLWNKTIPDLFKNSFNNTKLLSQDVSAASRTVTSASMFYIEVTKGSDTNYLNLLNTTNKTYIIQNIDPTRKVMVKPVSTETPVTIGIPANSYAWIRNNGNVYDVFASDQVLLNNTRTIRNKTLASARLDTPSINEPTVSRLIITDGSIVMRSTGAGYESGILFGYLAQSVSEANYNLPDGNASYNTLVCASATQTLVNKTVSGGTLKNNTLCVLGGTPVNAVNASYRTAIGKLNGELLFTARTAGALANGIGVEYIKSGVSGESLALEVVASKLSITLQTTSANAVSTTASQIAVLIRSDSTASGLVTVATTSGAGASLVTALSASNLSGGIDGTLGSANQLIVDASNLYFCSATNTVSGKNWKKKAWDSL